MELGTTTVPATLKMSMTFETALALVPTFDPTLALALEFCRTLVLVGTPPRLRKAGKPQSNYFVKYEIPRTISHRVVHLKATSLAQYTSRKFSEDQESEVDINKAKNRRIRELINTENMRKPFRAIHSSVTPGHGGGLSKLFVPFGERR